MSDVIPLDHCRHPDCSDRGTSSCEDCGASLCDEHHLILLPAGHVAAAHWSPPGLLVFAHPSYIWRRGKGIYAESLHGAPVPLMLTAVQKEPPAPPAIPLEWLPALLCSASFFGIITHWAPTIIGLLSLPYLGWNVYKRRKPC